ncbi:hypothetical protein K488DRAFT_82924 [Vararia minispora EC-137]|uniref:Uncharacterized protein n=1 Tax=Vararia minispora EC-137 TaxID=1314806 RepID=A0ACB8QV97_9AGAM|nr:hypothetical protein K488DRAFT_82924 [Vararia minispora EC-137]
METARPRIIITPPSPVTTEMTVSVAGGLAGESASRPWAGTRPPTKAAHFSSTAPTGPINPSTDSVNAPSRRARANTLKTHRHSIARTGQHRDSVVPLTSFSQAGTKDTPRYSVAVPAMSFYNFKDGDARPSPSDRPRLARANSLNQGTVVWRPRAHSLVQYHRQRRNTLNQSISPDTYAVHTRSRANSNASAIPPVPSLPFNTRNAPAISSMVPSPPSGSAERMYRVPRKPVPQLSETELAVLEADEMGVLHRAHESFQPALRTLPASAPPLKRDATRVLPCHRYPPVSQSDTEDEWAGWTIVRRPGMPVRRYETRKRHGMLFDDAGAPLPVYTQGQVPHSEPVPVIPARVLRTAASTLTLRGQMGAPVAKPRGLGKLGTKIGVVTKALFGIHA